MLKWKNNILWFFRICIIFPIFGVAFFPDVTFAGQCLITDKPAPVLIEYRNNLRKVISNITKEISDNTSQSKQEDGIINNLKNDLTRDGNDITRIFNEAIHWDGYFSFFNFFAVFPINNEVPHQIMRDHNLIETEQEWLNKYLATTLRLWYGEEELTNICSGVSNCTLEWKTKDIIGKLIQNTSKIANLYRETVIWDNAINKDILILVPQNFRLELEKYYGGDTIKNCSNNKWWFFETIWKSIQEIEILNKEWEYWVKVWKDSWKLVNGTMSDADYQREEKRILTEWLSWQWISADNRWLILDNLDKYNQSWWFSSNNNFLSNTFNSIRKSISSQFDSFKESIKDVFKEKEVASISELTQTKKKEDISLQIEQSIEKLYQWQVQLISIQDVNTAKTRQSIIEMHVNLSSSIKILEETEPISQKVCNSQAQWVWKCN